MENKFYPVKNTFFNFVKWLSNANGSCPPPKKIKKIERSINFQHKLGKKWGNKLKSKKYIVKKAKEYVMW
jgi:hypothetical protein